MKIQENRQTLWIEADKISECVKTDENGQEFVETNFDELVNDFISSIQDQNGVIMQMIYCTSTSKLFCIITYLDEQNARLFADLQRSQQRQGMLANLKLS